jgi:hypothetical protein
MKRILIAASSLTPIVLALGLFAGSASAQVPAQAPAIQTSQPVPPAVAGRMYTETRDGEPVKATAKKPKHANKAGSGAAKKKGKKSAAKSSGKHAKKKAPKGGHAAMAKSKKHTVH